MVKVLICGDVCNESWPLLVTRLEELQFSNHGPFDVLFLTNQLNLSFDVITPSFEKLQMIEIHIVGFADPTSNYSGRVWPPFFTVLEKQAGIFNAHKNLTVAYLFHDQSLNESEITDAICGMGYRGCDILITNNFPAGCEQNLSDKDFLEFVNSGLNSIHSSLNVAKFATLVRPRYHIISSHGIFYQRPPYVNHCVDNKPRLFSRLIAIAPVSNSKEKSKKWMHALSLNPIIYMKVAEIEESPAEFTVFPYGNDNIGVEDSIEQPHKRFRHLDNNPSCNSFFFDGIKNVSNIRLNYQSTQDMKTLFIGGLSRDSTERDLKQILPNACHVRRVAGKSFAFAEFSDHESAERVLTNANRGNGLVLQNRKLSVGWSSSPPGKAVVENTTKFDVEAAMRERELIPPTEDANTLYIGNVPNVPDAESKLRSMFEGVSSVRTGKFFAFLEFVSFEKAMLVITKSINERIFLDENLLVIGWAKAPKVLPLIPTNCKVLFIGNIPTDASQNDVESLCTGWSSIRRPIGREYAFMEFDGPDEALEASKYMIANNAQLRGKVLKIGWAQGKAADKLDQSSECWFCLASPTVKIHLIVSVGNFNYLAIPRGGIVDHHVLVCPIDCVPSRVHLSTESRSEQDRFCHAVQAMFGIEKKALLLFERALRTKNSRDHMQIHLVPLPFDVLCDIMQVFSDISSRYGVEFVEIHDDRSVEDVVLTMDGGPYQEYFYLEIPYDATNPACRKRFIYVQDNEPKVKFPMFFGSEMVAQTIKKPERANWKNCTLSEIEESNLADEIRDIFVPHDFTSSS